MDHQMEWLKQRIQGYLAHLYDIDYLAATVSAMPLDQFCEAIATLLKSENYETIGDTGLFIQDLVRHGRKHPDCIAFVDHYLQSVIFQTLEQLVYSSDHFLCVTAASVLDQTTFTLDTPASTLHNLEPWKQRNLYD